ncbi:Fpg/Nei family DNA glycosylase [Mycolicibacterium fallax]|uniref:Endonuclease 8 1 n=1 Tax=Mycolicibacterium fallax TaxID=1793 RepID=A0A1X1QYV0_MYCFA|nr:DNA-formamidopyrimidine glycosylase family protein [Mycolicibacterium fallax]ORU96634.1 DNA glycosylase [Mycolicibacterium fallax]BBY98042.1 formamidopyrimidine-DNA glycosylase [Mycolicibacterium fallax]
MPEGHVLHRLARLHQRRYGGQPVRVGSPQGRFSEGAAAVDGRVLRRADAWGKHLFHHYEPGLVVHVHLGIYGAFSEFGLDGDGPPDPVGQVRMRMLGTDYGTDLRGPMVCEVIDEGGVAGVLDRLGPDPLRADADPEAARTRVGRSRRSIGSLLMDQSVFAGVGNIYRSEVLFRHGIDPARPGTSIDAAEFDAIWADLVALMKIGQRRGQIVVVRPEDDHGAPSYRAGRPRTYVYRRAGEACRICGSPVLTTELEGRNLFWCPSCQS